MVSQLYDRVASRYDCDWSGIYAGARAHCIDQITAELAAAGPIDAVDFGIGTGNALHELRGHIELGRCTGFDVSRGMLTQARNKLGGDVQLVHTDAAHAGEYVPPDSVDLALSHFLLSFIDADRLLSTAHRVLRPGGLLSLATSTQRSLIELHTGRFRRASKLFRVKRSLHKAHTPRDHGHCLEMLRGRGFEIVSERLHRQPVRFESFADVRSWALDSGWVASKLDDKTGLRIASSRVLFALAEIYFHPLYPVDAVNEISIVLARKPGQPGRIGGTAAVSRHLASREFAPGG